jgi:alpha-mannosidase
MLRTSFPVGIYTDEVHCEVQFGHLKRQTHRNTMWDYAKDEICAHHWIDLSQPDYGVALLNDSKYGHRVHRNVMDLNLLRGPGYPDPNCDRARHQFVYAILPHEGDFIRAQVYKEGYELNVPVQVGTATGEAARGSLPASAMEIGSSRVMIEAVKKAEDSDELVIRLYETSGSNVDTQLLIRLAHESAALADLMENALSALEGEGGRYALSFKPFEIKTVKVRL